MLRSGLGIAALSLALFAADACADSYLEIESIDSHTGEVGAAFLDLLPFDEALGTLTEVTVEISGLIQAGIRVPYNVGPYNTPGSMNLVAQVHHDFDRQAGQFFEFGSAAKTTFQQVVPTLGQTVVLSAPFRYSFVVNASTDMTGGNISPSVGFGAVPPYWVQALVADFLPKGPTDLNQILLRQELVGLSGGADPEWVHTVGSMIVGYRYDRPEPPPPPIPEPGSIGLVLCCGLIAIAWRRARRR